MLSTVASAEEKVEYNRDIRPILSNHCFQCHGPDAKKRRADLRFDVRESAIEKTEFGGSAIVPNKPEASELIRRVTTADADERMPPKNGPKQLTAKQIATLKAWIEQGAEYQSHWAFITPERPKLPRLENDEWALNPIDSFVLAKLKGEGMSPARMSSRETLIRRVAFDLTGLPPTLAEIDTFLADKSPQAYERMVDRYLNSPAYGEHLARHWLDLARYADTNSYQYDTEREQWVWRDWVIDAYNRNVPFDKFTVEQLAGDLLPDSTPQQRLATGFNRNHGITIEGGIIDEEYRTEYVMDRLITTSATWMGLTVGCARCHDHKFDPLSQKEFYQMYAFFNQVPERGMRGFAPQEKIASPLARVQMKGLEAELSKLKVELNRSADIEKKLEAWATKLNANITGWQVLTPTATKSTGGSTLSVQDDQSILVGGANPGKDIYEITARTDTKNLTAVRLEALTHQSLPGGGPGRHSNSNFVLSEFELTVTSVKDPKKKQKVKFVRAMADYSQKNYEIGKTIDGIVTTNNGWAVDGPTRKKPATALFIASAPFGFEGGTTLKFRLRHEANFATHGIGRPRLSVTVDAPTQVKLHAVPNVIRLIASKKKPQRTSAEQQQLRDYFLKNHHPHQALKQRIAALEKQQSGTFPATMIMKDRPQPRATHILKRGQYNEPAQRVEPGVPAILPKMADDGPNNRLGFAQWLISPEHPLTSRVAVNRYWQRLFGLGLVKTGEDFGVQGELPSHPELLDWLASEFIRTEWDVKRMQRLIVTSATYRQTSHVGRAAYSADPENRLLARGPRLRLDGEEIRDAMLANAGLLVTRLGGKSVYPYQPKGLWLELNNRPGYSKAYPQGKADQLYRRSMYTFWKRTVPSPMLKTFDAPEREFCTVQRSRTNTPLQALLLLNGPQFVEAARNLATRMINEGGKSAEDQISLGFRLVTARQPTSAEVKLLREAYDAELNRFAKDDNAVLQSLKVGDTPLDTSLSKIELAAMFSVARLLLNLDEAITKE